MSAEQSLNEQQSLHTAAAQLLLTACTAEKRLPAIVLGWSDPGTAI